MPRAKPVASTFAHTDREAFQGNVPRLEIKGGSIEVCYEKRPGSLYSAETPTGAVAGRPCPSR